MVFALELHLVFRNVARRNAARNLLENRIGAFERFGVDSIEVVSGREENALLVVVRFVSEADRDAVWALMDSDVGTDVNGPLAGSYAVRHACTHDAAEPAPCGVGERRDW